MIQHFRKRPNWTHAGMFAKGVYYDGTNLSEVAELGAEIWVMPGETPRVRFRDGSLVNLIPDMWVVRDASDECRIKWAVNVLTEVSLKCVYEGPYTEDETASLKAETLAQEQENAVEPEPGIEGPSRPRVLNTGVRGDTGDEIVERAVTMGREAFGQDADVRVEFTGSLINSNNPEKGKFYASVRIYDLTKDAEPEPARAPELNSLTVTVRAPNRDDLRAEAILAGRKFFGMGCGLDIKFTSTVRHCTGIGQVDYEVDALITEK